MTSFGKYSGQSVFWYDPYSLIGRYKSQNGLTQIASPGQINNKSAFEWRLINQEQI